MAIEDMESTRFDKLSGAKQVEIASKGGKASVEARRKKKTMQEQAKMLLELNVTSDKTKKKKEALGIKKDELTNQMLMIVSMFKEACNGNVKAFEKMQELTGCLNNDGTDNGSNGTVTINFNYGKDDDYKKFEE